MSNEVALSPLQMNELIYNRIQVEVNSLFEPTLIDEFIFDGVEIQTVIATAVKQGQEKLPIDLIVKVQICISNTGEDIKMSPYNIDIEAQAFFHLHEEFQCADRHELVRVNGASMIIGSIRELITMLTSRSNYGVLNLPSLRIVPSV